MTGSRGIVLVDQDGPLADWESEFLRRWRETYPDLPWLEQQSRRSPSAWRDYVELEMPHDKAEIKAMVKGIYECPGFYRNLPPVDGARDALYEMLAAGFDVRICTAPLSNFKNCVLEKYEWINEYLGECFVDRITLTRYKEFVRGDYLIDDRPEPTGGSAPAPVWQHILFDAPYNRTVQSKPRLVKWSDWQAVLNHAAEANAACGLRHGCNADAQ